MGTLSLSNASFLSIPLELRELIYSFYQKPADRLIRNPALDEKGYFGGIYKFDFALWRVNKQIYFEAKRVWKRENLFVKIATPWPSAVNHIASEGLVPIVCADQKADQFEGEQELVQIKAPFHQSGPEFTIVMLLDDLHLFTQTWYYSALSYPMLNHRLSAKFMLQNPAGKGNQTSQVSLELQQRLLLPFEQIKGLRTIEILGFVPEVKSELQRRMAIPIPTVSECCDEATNLLLQGDAELSSGKPNSALKIYNKAFKAIHIIIQGRTRRVLADAFFHESIVEGRYVGQTGTTVRVILRLRLVSHTIASYLALGMWGEAAFWGIRSILIMREAMDTDFDDFLSEFAGGADVGFIHVRTAVAFWKMEMECELWEKELKEYQEDNGASSNSLWSSASKYLRQQNKQSIRKELNNYGVSEEIIRLFTDLDEVEDTRVVNNGTMKE